MGKKLFELKHPFALKQAFTLITTKSSIIVFLHNENSINLNIKHFY